MNLFAQQEALISCSPAIRLFPPFNMFLLNRNFYYYESYLMEIKYCLYYNSGIKKLWG